MQKFLKHPNIFYFIILASSINFALFFVKKLDIFATKHRVLFLTAESIMPPFRMVVITFEQSLRT